MERFDRTIQGYDPKEVNEFLDKVIVEVESMIAASKEKDKKITNLELANQKLQDQINILKSNNNPNMDSTLYIAQKASDEIKESACLEKEMIVSNAKKDADRIVNEALLRAEKTNDEADMLRRNIKVFKHRLKSIVEAQLEVIEDIDHIDL
jgi:cell division initiation protein